MISLKRISDALSGIAKRATFNLILELEFTPPSLNPCSAQILIASCFRS
jgi:hypothetical protein